MQEMSNKSLSDTNISEQTELRTPPGFVFQRYSKRVREPDYDSSELSAFKEEMKNMISTMMASQHEELKKIYPTLMEIKNTNVGIESAMSILSAQNDALKNKIEQLEAQTKTSTDYITLLEEKIEDLQRANRKSNIEIKNVPKLPKETREDLIRMTTNLSEAVHCTMDVKDVRDIYRVHNKHNNTKNSTIVVELGSTILKTELLKKTKEFNRECREKLCARHLGFKSDEYTPIYVAEQLTAKAARLFFLARDLAKSKEYKFCWTAYGKVHVKKDVNSSTITIKNEAQVNYLMQQK